jgi:hypothetical protein
LPIENFSVLEFLSPFSGGTKISNPTGESQVNFTAKFFKTALPFAAAACIALPALADVIDQNYTPAYASFCGGAMCEWQQVVTPGLTGVLTGIQIFAFNSPVDLRIGAGSGPVFSNWLAQLNNVSTTGFIDLSSFNIHVTAGQSFVFDVRNGSGYQGNYTGSTPNPAGNLFLGYGGAPVSQFNANWNLGYVTRVNAVPEPESYAMLLGGLGLLAMVARRRKPA